MARGAQDTQAEPGHTPMPLQGLSQALSGAQRVDAPLDVLEERQRLLLCEVPGA